MAVASLHRSSRIAPGAAPVAVAMLLALALAGCGKSGEKDAEAAKPSAPTAADSGIVALEPEAVAHAGIHVAPAAAATIDVTLELPGDVRFDPQRVLEVKPRFAGVVHSLRKQVGDHVGRGEVVADIESNESLTTYTVTSSIAGRVIARPMAVGQTVTPDASLYTIADGSVVWIDFAIYPNDVPRIHAGARARVALQSASDVTQTGTVSYVGPSANADTRVTTGRVVVPNRDGRWEPGLFADVTVTVDRATAAIAVPDDAVVRTNDGPVVFVPAGTNRYRRQAVRTGRTDGIRTEILGGIAPGTAVVDHGAYILKSELEKANVEGD